MPVTITANTESFDTGFRAWVTVSNAATAGAATSVTVSVQLRWDPEKVDYVGADPSTATAPVLTEIFGLATWTGISLNSGASVDLGVILDCADGVTETVEVTGNVAVQGGGPRDKDTAYWNCGTSSKAAK